MLIEARCGLRAIGTSRREQSSHMDSTGVARTTAVAYTPPAFGDVRRQLEHL